MGKQMSKEILEEIRASEAEADRIVAEAEQKASQMRAEAEAAGQKKCEAAEAEAAAALKKALEAAGKQAQAITDEAVKASQTEIDAEAAAANARMEDAVQIVIGGLKAKCR